MDDVPANDPSDPVDHSRLMMPHGLWFIGPRKAPRDIFVLCRSLAKRASAEEVLVAAFTDQSGAEEYLDRMAEKNVLRPFRPPGPQALVALLKALEDAGHTHLAIDPHGKVYERIPIRSLILAFSQGERN